GGVPAVLPAQPRLGPPGRAPVILLDIGGGDHVPAHEDRDNQDEPAEHRGLAVPRAPAGDSFDNRHGDSSSSVLRSASVPSLRADDSSSSVLRSASVPSLRADDLTW